MIEDLIDRPTWGGSIDMGPHDRGNNKTRGCRSADGPKAIDQGGVGYYRHKMVWNFPEWPEILLGDEWLDDKGRYIEPTNNVDAMVRMADRGMSQLEIAEQLGVSQSTVSRGLRKVREAAMPA